MKGEPRGGRTIKCFIFLMKIPFVNFTTQEAVLHISVALPDDWFDNFLCCSHFYSLVSPPHGVSSTLKRGPCLVEQTENKSFIASLILSTTIFIALSCYHLSHSAFRLMALGCCMKITSWKYYTHCHNSITIRGVIIGGNEANWKGESKHIHGDKM